MAPSDRTHRLQQLADLRAERPALRRAASGVAVLGACTAFGAVLPPPDPLLGLLGALVLGVGLWNLSRPRPAGLLVGGASLTLVGLYGILGHASVAGPAGAALGAKLGLLEVVVGAHALWRHRRLRRAFPDPPHAEEVRAFDALVSDLLDAHVPDDPDVIEFRVDGLRLRVWRMRLADDVALLVADRGREVRVVRHGELHIEEVGRAQPGHALRVAVRLDGRRLEGSLTPDSMERFRRWASGVGHPRALAA